MLVLTSPQYLWGFVISLYVLMGAMFLHDALIRKFGSKRKLRALNSASIIFSKRSYRLAIRASYLFVHKFHWVLGCVVLVALLLFDASFTYNP